MAISERRREAIAGSAELGRQARTANSQERYEQYVELRRKGCTNQVAAWNLGISRRQAERYSLRFGKEPAPASAVMAEPGEPTVPSQDMDALVDEMVPTATDLVIQVRDCDQESIAELLEPMGVQELRTLAVLLAAMVPDQANIKDLLAWVDDPFHLALKECCNCRRPSCRACDLVARRAAA
jgi:hypothetical protein